MSGSNGGHLLWKVVQGCAAVITPFFLVIWHSLAYQFAINVLVMCPILTILEKCNIFTLLFIQNFSSEDTHFPNFCSQNPSFLKENLLLRPYIWKSVLHTPTHQKNNYL